MKKYTIDKRPTMLMILDGYGINENSYGNAVLQSKKPNLDRIMQENPYTTLNASGLDVGLPDGQMGNSEVGHLNIGAGRIVYQELTRITKEINEGRFFTNPVLLDIMNKVKSGSGRLHLMGLLSDGGVHSHIEHLKALIKMAKEQAVPELYIHCFTDGRDVAPTSAVDYVSQLLSYIKELNYGNLQTLSGRYYAMDRDRRWDRVKKAYDCLVGIKHIQKQTNSPEDYLKSSYTNDVTDEFILPAAFGDGYIQNGDGIIMFNFRPDRAREITRAFTENEFSEFEICSSLKLAGYVSMTQYDATFNNVRVAYPPEHIQNTLGHYIASLGLSQLRIAETEKYAHVTFFFNGGVEEPEKGEDRILVSSPKVATYDMQPEMSANEVCDKVIAAIGSSKYDMIILNFANPDMVGHTGNMAATIKAIEAMDTLVGRIEKAILASGGQLFITADHGNADVMLDEDGNPVTSHSTKPVPFVRVATDKVSLNPNGRLCDIAPTMLDFMGLPIPVEMTGHSLKG